MAFAAHASPESRLPRTDSKNPATTCKGITSAGRPCRRGLAASTRSRGVLAVLPPGQGHPDGAAAFYCWQHQDQAHTLTGTGPDAATAAAAAVAAAADGHATLVPLHGRTSTESLAARLGVLAIDEDEPSSGGAPHAAGQSSKVRRSTLPLAWQQVPGPLMAVRPPTSQAQTQQPSSRRKRKGRGDLHVSFFCCMRPHDIDDDPPPRPPRPMPAARPLPPRTSAAPSRPVAAAAAASPIPKPVVARPAPAMATPPSVRVRRSGAGAGGSAYTEALRSFIPADTAPSTVKALLDELAKPLSPSDREPGYIYIFWITPTRTPVPGRRDATALLAAPTIHSDAADRRASAILRTYSVARRGGGSGGAGSHRRASGGGGGGGETTDPQANRALLLKIGRANNVHRRMHEWSRQCGQQVTLLRYYPQARTARGAGDGRNDGNEDDDDDDDDDDDNSDSDGENELRPYMVPLVPRVERLIHLELQAQRIVRACEGCGRQHREWFEVEATREGVRRVDATVRRWVAWAETEGAGV